MKPLLEHISLDESSSILAYWREEDSFDFNWHFHPEYELTYIHKATGTRLVGDQVEQFHDGDLVLLGPNLPHTWATDTNRSSLGNVSAVVIQFKQALMNSMYQLPEMRGINMLLAHSGRGISFHASTSEEIARRLANLPSLTGLERLSSLLQVLDYLSKSSAFRMLASPLYNPSFGKENEKRIDRVCTYLHQRYSEHISLSLLAAEVNLTETSLCRFFKRMTGKTISEYLNDLRVNKACSLLTEGYDSIPEVAYASGFNSMTHFNRMFLKKNKMPPTAYRKQFSSK